MINSPELITTADGSRSLFLAGMGEHYHSVNGAFTESSHVFIKNGLLHGECPGKTIILEIGFGTGLNALLTALESFNRKMAVDYYTLDKYPLEKDITEKLDYGAFLGGNAIPFYREIHENAWEQLAVIHPWFRIFKMEKDLLSFIPDEFTPYDVVYFDAFGPDKQPEMWSFEIFRRIFGRMNSGGVFVTYSAKGEVRRRLASAGFAVQRLPGPPGKREMLRGIKK
jgi:tRNA U34 5-methylaminomethyl-2-thiouridine-forming methyltransferase MnmC